MIFRIVRSLSRIRKRRRIITPRLTRGPALLGCLLSATSALAAIANTAGAANTKMRMKISADAVEFLTSDGALAGRYNYTDAFKPYVHPLQSPKGHSVSLVSPHDHQHHKGLMYALRIPELNFWEERSTLPGEAVGRQRHLAFSEQRESGGEAGFTQTLSWEPAGGGEAVFEETRRISCRRDGAAFVWTWDTTLKSRRATRLVQSQWSHKKPDGGKINYHGLGLRLRREFGGGTRNNGLQLDDAPIRWNKGSARFDFTTAMGATPARATFIGSIDGIWPTPQVAVTLAQGQRNALFVMEEPFAFFTLGPSNLAERPLAAGETLREHYTVTVADVDLKPRTAP
ncbi:MAG: PmoA family protein [Opitutaceae bacterium]|nr:PmoA family protein [Opitutaceae bacterium]